MDLISIKMEDIMCDLVQDQKRLSKRITTITKELRDIFYRDNKDECRYTIPFGGQISDSIGCFPEIILKGRHCQNSSMGLCSPCFYSRYSKIAGDEVDYKEQLIEQCQYIVDNFDKIILNNQKGKVTYNPESISSDPISMVFTPIGSFFNNWELPQDIRIDMLKILLAKSESIGRDFIVYVETYAKDIIPYDFDTGAGIEEYKLLKALNVRVLIGLESSNSFTRNVLYNKDISLEEYKKAVRKLKKYDLPVGSFVFAGISPMNNYETIIDVNETLDFLCDHGVAPVLMFQNIQEYTIHEILYNNSFLEMLEPLTLAQLVSDLLEKTASNSSLQIDSWLIADPIGGPPEPKYNLFTNQNKVTCDNCSSLVYDAIHKLRISRDASEFEDTMSRISNCSCYDEYKKQINIDKTDNDSIVLKTERMIDKLEEFMDDYRKMNNIIELKSALLCYGISISKDSKDIINNDYAVTDEQDGFSKHSTHLLLDEIVVNTTVYDDDAQTPFQVFYNSEHEGFELYYKKQYLRRIDFLKLPDWCKGEYKGNIIADVMRPHSLNCISILPIEYCAHKKDGGCKFCSFTYKKDDQPLDIEKIAYIVSKALLYNPNYEFNLSMGVYLSNDETVKYSIDLCREMKKLGCRYISVELALPTDLDLLEELHKAGAASVIINLEVYDEVLRREICPSKNVFSNKVFFEKLRRITEIFGKGNVGSVLLVGVDTLSNIEDGIKEFVKNSIVPILIPFKGYDGCQLKGSVVPHSDLIHLNELLINEMNHDGFSITSSGCIGCGGCSLEFFFNNC